MITSEKSVSGLVKENDDCLISKRQAWFAFAMTCGLMLVDYIDRQVIVSLFPHIKNAWQLSDKQLGGLVSIISIVVALGSIPIALLADRLSRVKSVFVMATTWSLATVSCTFTQNYSQLFLARAVVGAGEAGYGSIGVALITTIFPQRMRGALLGAFFAAASLGSVLGVALGGVIAAKWGWKAAFGIVGAPGLIIALLYLFVRDYKTVALPPQLSQTGMLKQIFITLARTPTLLWLCVGAAIQLIVVSAVWSWLPSYLHRFNGVTPEAAAKQAALVVLVGALGSVFWGMVVDRVTAGKEGNKFFAMAVLCVITQLVFLMAFGDGYLGSEQFKLILAGGFLMTCTVGVVAGITMDVVHPGLRSTGAAVLALFQNLFGMAMGPFLVGVLSDQFGLQYTMTIVPLACSVAAICFIVAARSYDSDVAKIADVQLNLKTAVDRLPASII